MHGIAYRRNEADAWTVAIDDRHRRLLVTARHLKLDEDEQNWKMLSRIAGAQTGPEAQAGLDAIGDERC